MKAYAVKPDLLDQWSRKQVQDWLPVGVVPLQAGWVFTLWVEDAHGEWIEVGRGPTWEKACQAAGILPPRNPLYTPGAEC